MLTDKDRCQIPVGLTGKCGHSRKLRITRPEHNETAIYVCYPHLMYYLKAKGGDFLVEVLKVNEAYDARKAWSDSRRA